MLQRASDVRVSGKNLDIGSSLRGQAEERVHDAVAKYFDGGFRSRVTVEKEGTGFRADCTVHLDTGAVMHVSGSAHDAYSSVSQVVERIGKQMRRDKRKRQAYAHGATQNLESTDILPLTEETTVEPFENSVKGTSLRAIVAEKVEKLDRVTLQQAIDHLELGRLSSYAFRNKGTGRVNLLHERADGSIGWIDVDDRVM